MATPRYYKRPGRAPVWRVRWQLRGESTERHFATFEEAAAYIQTLPSTGRHVYASDEDRVTLNVTVDEAGCWNWNLYKHPAQGYGYLTLRGERLLAHRFSYETFVGPIPDGLQIDHLCRNRACVNPEHLEPVTPQTNILRSPIAQGALNAAKTHCPQGHPYSQENTYRQRNGRGRLCRTCNRAAVRASKIRRALRAANVSERAA